MFTLLVSLTALLVAGVAAFFSVKGIGMLFAGAMVETMVMAGSLELGKLVCVSFLYRYFYKIPLTLKAYLIGAVIILMSITSLGIYGFLSAAYQKSASEYGIFTQQVSLLEKQKEYVSNDLKSVDDRIKSLNDARRLQEDSLNKSTTTNVGGKQASYDQLSQSRRIQENTMKLITDSSKEVSVQQKRQEELLNKIKDFDMKVMELKETSKHNKDIVTFQFIADAIGWPLNKVVQWFIVVIIIVFDPLAVGLVLAYNIMVCGKLVRDEKIESVGVTPTVVEKIESPKIEPIIVEKKIIPIKKTKVEPIIHIEKCEPINQYGESNNEASAQNTIIDEIVKPTTNIDNTPMKLSQSLDIEKKLETQDDKPFEQMMDEVSTLIENSSSISNPIILSSQEIYDEEQKKIEAKRNDRSYNVAKYSTYPNR